MKVFSGNREFNLTPSKLIGAGGEAEIYKIDNSKVAKIFKTEKHPDFSTNVNAQNAIIAKLQTYEAKLQKFPTNLPASVVSPIEILRDSKAKFAGYTMNLIDNAEVVYKLSERKYKEQSSIDAIFIIDVYTEIFKILKLLHGKGVVVGDFNDLNIMFKFDKSIFYIDVDSYQYDIYKTLVYTEKFVDPLKCNNNMQLAQPHDENSDWYAYTAMFMEALLSCGLYGGIHRPKSGKKFTQTERILNRVSIFHTDVQYPKPAYSIEILNPDFVKFLKSTIEFDKRGEFPIAFLNKADWKACKNCGSLHANIKCPTCLTKVDVKVQVSHNIRIRSVHETSGQIIYASYQNGFKFIYLEESTVKRENLKSVLKIGNSHNMRFRINKNSTVVAKLDNFAVISDNVEKFSCQRYGNLPLIDANSSHVYFVQGDVLYRTGQFGNSRIGDVIGNSTLFWVGEKFGFGFYRASNIIRGFTFDTESSGINDTVKVEFPGNLIDSTCAFSDDLCWFFTITQEAGKRVTTVHVIDKFGTLIERHVDPSWLPRIRGNCAVKKQLFVASDDGISRYQVGGEVREFIGTSDHCDVDSVLVFGDSGIYVVDRQKIVHLQV